MLTAKPLKALPQPRIEVLVHDLLQHLPLERMLPDSRRALDSRHAQEHEVPRAKLVQPLHQLEVALHGGRMQRGVILAGPLQRPIDVVDAEPHQKQRGHIAPRTSPGPRRDVLKHTHLVLEGAHAGPAAGHDGVRDGGAVEGEVEGQRQRRVVVGRQEPHPVLAAGQVRAGERRVADRVAGARLARCWVEPERRVRVAAARCVSGRGVERRGDSQDEEVVCGRFVRFEWVLERRYACCCEGGDEENENTDLNRQHRARRLSQTFSQTLSRALNNEVTIQGKQIKSMQSNECGFRFLLRQLISSL